METAESKTIIGYRLPGGPPFDDTTLSAFLSKKTSDTISVGVTKTENSDVVARVKLPGGWFFLSLTLSMKRTPKLYGKILKKVAG